MRSLAKDGSTRCICESVPLPGCEREVEWDAFFRRVGAQVVRDAIREATVLGICNAARRRAIKSISYTAFTKNRGDGRRRRRRLRRRT